MSDLHEHDHDHINEHDHAHEHDHDHAYLHAHGIPHSHGHVHENQKAVINRLSRAIGHLEKVKRMVEEGYDCSEVLVQLAAVRSALDNTGKVILKDHMRHCMVDAVAAEECEVLFVNISAFSGGAPGTVHEKLLRNLLTVSMRKNLSLSQRIFCTTPKTVRGRLLTYFSAQAARSGSLQFEIPFNRQQLADYLNLDRSALSKELCKMRDEGLLTFEKNRFALNELPE